MFQHTTVFSFQILLLSVGGDVQIPENQTAQPFSYVFFPCVYDEESVPVWKINDTYYQYIMLPDNHWSNNNGTGLIVKAVPEINNTKYQCWITIPENTELPLNQSPAYLLISGFGVDDSSPMRPPTPRQVAVNSTTQSLTVKMVEPLTAYSIINNSSCGSFIEASASFSVPCSELVLSNVTMQSLVELHIENYFDNVAPPGVADSLDISINVDYYTNGLVPVLDLDNQPCFESHLSETGCFDHTFKSYLIATHDSVDYCIDGHSCENLLFYQTLELNPEKGEFCLNKQTIFNISTLSNNFNAQEITIQEYCPKSLLSNSCGNGGIIHYYGNRAIFPLTQSSDSSPDIDCSTVCSYDPLLPSSSHDTLPSGCLSASDSSTLLSMTVSMMTAPTITNTGASEKTSSITESHPSTLANSSETSVYHTLAPTTSQPPLLVSSTHSSTHHTMVSSISQQTPPVTTTGLSVSHMPSSTASQPSLSLTSSSLFVPHTSSHSPSNPSGPLNIASIIAVCTTLVVVVLIFALVMTVKLLMGRFCSRSRGRDNQGAPQELELHLDSEEPPCDSSDNSVPGAKKLYTSMRPTIKQFHTLEITDRFGNKDSLSIIINMAGKWKTLGAHLDCTPQELDIYCEDYKRVEERCAKMLEDWIRYRKDCQWSHFLDVLKDMREHELLEKLQSAFVS